MATVGSLLIRLGLDAQAFTSGLDQSKRRISAIGKDLQSVGSSLTKSVTLPLTLIGGAAIKTATEFESGFAGVRKTVDATEEEFAGLRTELVNLSTELPATAESIFTIAEAAGQLGIEKQNIVDFTKTMLDLGNTTNISAEEGATAMARLANVTGLSQEQFSNLGSSLVDLGNNLATTEGEILEMSARLAGAGTTAGLTVADITGLAGALTSVGINAEAGGTAFSKVMINMAAAAAEGGEAIAKTAEVAGMSGEAFAEAFETDPARAIQSFVEGLGRIKESGGDLFGTLEELGIKEIRLRDALLRTANAGDLVGEALDISNEAFIENTALVAEAEQRYNTTASQMTVFLNKLTALGAQIGDLLLPALIKLVDAATPILEWIGEMVTAFGELDPAIQSTVGIFVAAFAAGGPILLVVGTFMTLLAGVTAPLLIGGAIVAGIIAAVVAIVVNWERIEKAGAAIWKSIVDNIQANIQDWVNAWENLKKKTLANWNAVVKGIEAGAKAITTFLKPAVAFFQGVTGAAKRMFEDVVGKSFVPDMVNGIAREFGRLDAVMVMPAQQAAAQVSEAFEGIGGQGASVSPLETDKMTQDLSIMSSGVENFKFNTVTALEDIRGAASQVWASVQTNFSSTLAGMIQGTNTFKEFMTQFWNTLLQAAINTFITIGLQWGISQFAMQTASAQSLVVEQEIATARLGIHTSTEAARLLITQANNKLMLGAAATTIAAMVAMGETAVVIAGIIVKQIAAIFAAIGAGLAAGILTAPLAPQFFAAAKVTLASGLTATALAGAAIVEAGATGLTAIGGLAAPIPGLHEGGIVTSPTLAQIGEGGQPEAVIPLDRLEGMVGGGKQQTLVLEIDGRRMMEKLIPQFPKVVRMKLGAAL